MLRIVSSIPVALPIVVVGLCLSGVSILHAEESPPRPNVLVVMVDDLGFSDIGCYGGEIETPTLDALAASGVRFSQFYNTAKCHSSRISLLTGCYAHQAGNTAMSHAVTSAEVLSRSGYFTAMTGKWHLDKQPTDFGFQRYFGHLSGACNYFRGDKTFRLNGERWDVPESGFYTTVADVDFALKFLSEARSSKKPWYLYVAFNAPHAPLHALPADYRKYVGKYDSGWDRMRDARIEKQKRLGLFTPDFTPSPRPDHVPAWDTLSEARRGWESRRMTALAAMIDRVDQELGRLVADLKDADELDNTMILFVSDNGACPYDRRSTQLDSEPTDGSFTWSDSTGWAWARNGPFRYYKQNQYEGGISTPAIVHWPAGLTKLPKGSIVDAPAHLIDVLPTLADVCQTPIPDRWSGRDLRPISGVSLAPILAGKGMASRPPIHLLFSADRGLRDGDWKAVSFRSQPWELYNLRSDRAELHNVANEFPERIQAMADTWTEMAAEVLHAPQSAYRPVSSKAGEKLHPEWTDFSKEPAPGNGKRNPKEPSRSNRQAGKIRARKNTSMAIQSGLVALTFSGDDPGIAIDTVAQPIVAGPYQLRFQLKSQANSEGEVFFTTDARTKLPNGKHVRFQAKNDGQWHDVRISLPTEESLFALRLDVAGDGDGQAWIRGLELTDQNGLRLRSWPR